MQSPTLAAVLCMASSPANTGTHPCVWGILHMSAADILLGRKFRQASLELVSYTCDTILFERRKLRHSNNVVVYVTRSLFSNGY